MTRIGTLRHLMPEQLNGLVTGYVTDARYLVEWSDAEEATSFRLRLVALAEPKNVRFSAVDDATLHRYRRLLPAANSLGAFDGERLVGVAVAEAHEWNKTLSVWEFHVHSERRRQGIGRQLMQALTARARQSGLRAIVCETQSTNVPAIRFYRRQGFQLEGVDIAFYTNQDWPDGDVAVFMRKQLG